MAFRKGISGNPSGRSNERMFSDALRVVGKRTDKKTKKQNMMLLAGMTPACAPPTTVADVPTRAICWRQSTAGSRRGSTRSI